jgi:transcription elongation factor S-II
MSNKIIENSKLFRENVKEKLNKILDNPTKSSNLEVGIFNYSLKEAGHKKIVKKWDNQYFVQIYTDRLRSIINNLKNNAELLTSITSGEIKSQNVAFMTHYELNPDKWKYLLEIKSKKDKNKFETNIEAATDTFTCRKCKGNKCSYYLLQTRSSDESTTIYVTCIECGNRWKTC